MNESMADGHVETFLTLHLETWAVASGNQRETQETDGGKKEEKDQDNTTNDDGQIFSTLVPETWAIASENRCKTQETGGDGEEPKVETNTCGEERSIIKDCSIKRIDGYEAHEFEGIAMENDVKAKMVNGHEELFPALVLETWALTDVRPKRQKLAARKQRSMLIRATLRWKWLSAARKRRTMEMYGSLHTRSRDLGINRCKTQEKDSDGEEARVKADMCNKEFEQNMTRDGDGQASHEDPKDVIKTSIKDTTVNESKCLEQGDDRDKGGTFMRLKRLSSRREQGAMTTSHGKAKKKRMIWWIGWQQ